MWPRTPLLRLRLLVTSQSITQCYSELLHENTSPCWSRCCYCSDNNTLYTKIKIKKKLKQFNLIKNLQWTCITNVNGDHFYQVLRGENCECLSQKPNLHWTPQRSDSPQGQQFLLLHSGFNIVYMSWLLLPFSQSLFQICQKTAVTASNTSGPGPQLSFSYYLCPFVSPLFLFLFLLLVSSPPCAAVTHLENQDMDWPAFDKAWLIISSLY